MAKYNSILSDDKIQKVFDKLQPLNADFISFGDFLFGSCIVSFKQKNGDIYKSGSVLIDENGEIIPIKTNGKSYDGLDCIEPGKEGSSLLLLAHIIDLDGNKTQYLHYAIDIHEERHGKPYWHWEEGIFDRETKGVAISDENLKSIQATLWSEKLMRVSYLDNEKRKYGVMEKAWNKWRWLITANFTFIEYKNGQIYTYNENDISLSKGCLYEQQLEPYIINEEDGFKKVIGTVVNSKDYLIRSGAFAGKKLSDINSNDFENYIKERLFISDDALVDHSEYLRAVRDSIIIENELLILQKDQIIDFKISKYVDNDGNTINVTCPINGCSFEDAFINHYQYINSLITFQKLKVSECVFDAMLLEGYASDRSLNKSRIISVKTNIYNLLSKTQFLNLSEEIDPKDFDKLDVKRAGNVLIINYSVGDFGEVECLDYGLYPRYLVVNKDGDVFCQGCTMVRYISDDIILYEKWDIETIWNEEKWNNPSHGPRHNDYHKDYVKVVEQGIINYKGEVIYKGELGDLSAASVKSQYLLLERPKFTEIERDKIEYYLSEFVGEEKDSCKCPECGGQAYWEEDEDCYICEDCEEHIEGEHQDRPSWKLSEKQLLAANNFEEVLSSEEVKHGQFITETEKERNDREYWEQEMQEDPEWQEEMRAMQEEREFWSDDEQEENYLEGKLYSLFSISKKSFLIPFQNCKILVNPPGYNPGIYLVDEQKEKGLTAGISLPFDPKLQKGEWVLQRSYWNGEFYHTLRGTVFHTIFDTFRYGPLTGMTLSLAFKKDFQMLVKYLQNSCVFVTTISIKQLWQKYYNERPKDIEKIILLRDLSFEFKEIKEVNDIIDGKASYYGIVEFGRDRFYDPIQDKGWHNGESFKDVMNNNPDYIIGLIKNNKIEVSNEILSYFTDNKTIYNQLKNAFEIQEKKKKEEEDRWPDYEPDYNDYERDTWNAMTDGQYGEMPEGFDGDYDFTGH